MKTAITFRNMQASDPMKDHVNERLERLDRYMSKPGDAHVVLRVEKNHHFAEIVITGKGITAKGEATTQDMYAAFEEAADKVEKTLRRHHDKKVGKRAQANRANP